MYVKYEGNIQTLSLVDFETVGDVLAYFKEEHRLREISLKNADNITIPTETFLRSLRTTKESPVYADTKKYIEDVSCHCLFDFVTCSWS